MSDAYEVGEPIQNSPFAEPERHWYLPEGDEPELREGRRPSLVFPPDGRPVQWQMMDGTLRPYGPEYPTAYELALVNRIRERVAEWRTQGWPGVTRTTHELLTYWTRPDRERRLFFAQVESVETIIFLAEARADLRQGITIPRDDPSDDKQADGFTGFTRHACKMATGSGKSTVMGMLAAWSILNKVNDRGNARFSDTVLIVCPNVTIRDRLAELDPEGGEASLYRTRDLVPSHLMPLLVRGRVLITNWHVFEPHGSQTGGVGAKVTKTGVAVRKTEVVNIGAKTTVARGSRYLTLADFQRQVAAQMLTVVPGTEEKDSAGGLKKVKVESVRYVESDAAVVNRVLRDVGGKTNLLVLNDEAHHAYRIRKEEDEDEDGLFGEDEEAEEYFQEATIWIEGLDRIQKLRGINLCVDLSATPYFLGRVGRDADRPFPWIVSDFGLTDAIESGLVKIPQLAVRDTTGAAIPGFFNVWEWVKGKLTPAERGGKSASPKPEAILKYASYPIAMLGGLWEEERQAWAKDGVDSRPPVFIAVCKNTKIAKVVYDWLADDTAPQGIPSSKIDGFRNRDGQIYTIRVDTKVVHETDGDTAKGDESRWMRFTLDTVGKTAWPIGAQGMPLYPEGFQSLAEKLARPLHPPGRDIRCIISVGMLTEGWDCNTVTHVIGLRPFQSQLLCEQVVGRGLRRRQYDVDENDRFGEEVAKVFGVPFAVVPFKSNGGGSSGPPKPTRQVRALPSKAQYAISFPRVEGYTQAIRNRVTVDWATIPPLPLNPFDIPPEVQMKAGLPNNQGRPTLLGPGKVQEVSLNPYRAGRRLQELEFDLARALTKDYASQATCTVPVHVLFPQMLGLVQKYVRERVEVIAPAQKADLFMSPYYGLFVEILTQAVRPDTSQGEAPEIPRYESSRGPGSTADVNFPSRRQLQQIQRCHVNYMVADTNSWEQQAAYAIDTHPATVAMVKNAGLGFAVPYLYNGAAHDYEPDFLIRLAADKQAYLILETKGYDPLADIKKAAAERWVAAVNADGKYGYWQYAMARTVGAVRGFLDSALAAASGATEGAG